MLKNEYNETFGRVRSADKEDVDVTMSINMGSVWDVA
jgi:hypothetical protein